jgi:5S rRNA maturation endonuclease (ribonuclease M5)
MESLESQYNLYKYTTASNVNKDLVHFVKESSFDWESVNNLNVGISLNKAQTIRFDQDFLKSYRLLMPKSIVFPYHCFVDHKKKVDHFEFKMLNKDSKFKYLKSKRLYGKESYFGIVKDRRNPNLIIAEGARDVISLLSLGFPNVITLSQKSNLSYDLLENLDLPEPFIKVMYDNDSMGRQLSDKLVATLNEMDIMVENLTYMNLGKYKDITEVYENLGMTTIELFDFK